MTQWAISCLSIFVLLNSLGLLTWQEGRNLANQNIVPQIASQVATKKLKRDCTRAAKSTS